MDVVLVGLPGSGKSAIGRRLASRHGATFIDTDLEVERAAGLTIPEIFESEGEASFRRRDRAIVTGLGPPDTDAERIARVIATGGGTVMDPRNRWQLYRGRRAVWLDARPEAIAQRLRHSPSVRPLVRGQDPLRAVRELGAARLRFYSAATRVNAMMEVPAVVAAAEAAAASPTAGTLLLRAETPIGTVVIGDGIAATQVDAMLTGLGARRALVVSEPGAWTAVGERLAGELAARGWSVESVQLPGGEAAKSLSTIEAAASVLAGLGVERGEPLVAIGGGALTDAAGFLAATYLRGVPVVHVPTTLVGQIDAAIGGKTAVDLPEGKNLVGAFHQPAAIVIDVALLATLPERERRAALAEAVKIAALGSEPLFELLEADGPAIAAGDPSVAESGALAELVERAAWAKVEVVVDDELESAGRIALNLGHSLGHALEAAAGFRGLLHGEAVAYGLRAAARIGLERGVTPPGRAQRIEALLDRLDIGRAPLDLEVEAVMGLLEVDKKRRAGSLQWILPTAEGHAIDGEVPETLVRAVATDVLAGRPAGAGVVAR